MADPISRIRMLNRSRKARRGIPPYYEVEDPATKAKYRVYGAESQQEADQRVWNDVAMQRSKGGEQEIELPSELPAERQEFLDKADKPQPKASVSPIKQPPIVKFRQEAAEIERALPPVSEGHVRLWRGNRSKDEVGKNPSFTTDLPGIALPFKNAYGGPLSYVDVPADDIKKYGRTSRGSTDVEYTLSPEVASKAKPVGVGAAAGGVVEPGNIDLSNRPTVSNDDGSVSTVSSMSFEEDGVEILVPTISDDGKRLTEKEAKALYKKTGKHLGKFKDADSATAFAKNLSKEQAQTYRPKKEPKKLEPGLYLDEETDKYFKVTESGDMVEVNLDAETP